MALAVRPSCAAACARRVSSVASEHLTATVLSARRTSASVHGAGIFRKRPRSGRLISTFARQSQAAALYSSCRYTIKQRTAIF